jgi:hypothetical protein
MALTVPVLNGEPGTWDTSINASLARIDLHDHSSGLGVPIPSDGILIDADLTFGGYALTNVKAVKFTAQAAAGMTSYAGSIFLGTDNEFYLRKPNGTNVQATNGSSLNISLVGGIAGDYAGAAASLYYDDANETYRFLEAAPSPNDWSRVAVGDVDLYEHASGITNRVRLSSPAALAASYVVTWPAAVPGSTLPVQMAVDGTLSLSTTFTALVTAQAGVTASANQHVTVSGTGAFKHGDRVKTVSALAASWDASLDNWQPATGAGALGLYAVGNGLCYLAPDFNEGERVTSVTVARSGDSAADLVITVYVVGSDGQRTSIGTATVTNPNATVADTTIDVTDTTLASGNSIVVEFEAQNNINAITLYNVRFTFDRP